jgi:hypothetical protein
MNLSLTLRLPLFAIAAGTAAGACAAQRLTITVTHDLAIARPAETIAVPWKSVNDALPHAGIQHIAVKDAAGRVLAHQVTNVAPEAKDPQRNGVAYGELLFQHDFAPGEKSATFTVEKSEAVAAPFPSRVSARIVPERLDDFAWENDKVAHRTYGPALAAPAPAGSDKEVLKTSGLDIWFKRVPYPIVDRWYNIGHDHYHHDEGEGIDMYNVSARRSAPAAPASGRAAGSGRASTSRAGRSWPTAPCAPSSSWSTTAGMRPARWCPKSSASPWTPAITSTASTVPSRSPAPKRCRWPWA